MNAKQLLALKPGQKVTIIKGIKKAKDSSIVNVSDDMIDYAGKVVTVKHVGTTFSGRPVVSFEETDDYDYNSIQPVGSESYINPYSWLFSPELVRYARKSDYSD